MNKFFITQDFEAFHKRLAKSTDEKVIRNRTNTVNKLKNLHELELKDALKKRGLSSHWKKEHLTNVVWPLKQANGEYVDYVRMGYGKPKSKIQKLAQLVGLRTVDANYAKDDMAFHHVTQMQISLDQNNWCVALYLDKKGWVEEKNLVNKIKSNPHHYKEMYMMLEAIMKEGYILYLYSEKGDYYYENIHDYITDIMEYSEDGVSYTIHICKELELEDRNNYVELIADYIQSEFQKLEALYRFISWDENNNYIG